MSSLKEINPKIGFKEVLQSPTTYMLMVAVSGMWFFIYQFTGVSNGRNEVSEAEKAALRKELIQVRAEKDALVNAILIKNNIIFAQERDKKELDSALRDGPGKKAKQIVKEQ
jgi:hypothetical protein